MNLPVVEILKLGLSGFCFLLAYFIYDLLKKEQVKQEPRPTFSLNIRLFMGLVLLLGILVGVLPVITTLISGEVLKTVTIRGKLAPNHPTVVVYAASTTDTLQANETEFILRVTVHKNVADCPIILTAGKTFIATRVTREALLASESLQMQDLAFDDNVTTRMAEEDKKPNERSSYNRLDSLPPSKQRSPEYEPFSN